MKKAKFLNCLALAIVLAGCGSPDMTPPTLATGGKQSAALAPANTGVTVFPGKIGNYTLQRTENGITVTDQVGQGGTVTIPHPKRLVFSDIGIAFDLDGIAGQAFRIYRAAFNRSPDEQGLGFWIDQMDRGMTLEAVAQGFVSSAEFGALYGANPSNEETVSKFYQNVLHRAPDPAGYDYWVGVLNRKLATTASVLAAIGESSENKQAVAPSISNGIVYVPVKVVEPVGALTLDTLVSCPDSMPTMDASFYQCMIGTIKGKTLFGGSDCTLTIAKNGVITLSAGAITNLLAVPYTFPMYVKSSVASRDNFLLSASAHDQKFSTFEMQALSPQYAAKTGLASGIDVNIDGLSCKFPL